MVNEARHTEMSGAYAAVAQHTHYERLIQQEMDLRMEAYARHSRLERITEDLFERLAIAWGLGRFFLYFSMMGFGIYFDGWVMGLAVMGSLLVAHMSVTVSEFLEKRKREILK